MSLVLGFLGRFVLFSAIFMAVLFILSTQTDLLGGSASEIYTEESFTMSAPASGAVGFLAFAQANILPGVAGGAPSAGRLC